MVIRSVPSKALEMDPAVGSLFDHPVVGVWVAICGGGDGPKSGRVRLEARRESWVLHHFWWKRQSLYSGVDRHVPHPFSKKQNCNYTPFHKSW